MKYVYVVICILCISMLSLDAHSEMEKKDHKENQTADQNVQKDTSEHDRATTEISFKFGTKFPHEPGPITKSQKWTFSKQVADAAILTNKSSPYCQKVDVLIADNLVYVVATFQAEWDEYVFAEGTFLVKFESDDLDIKLDEKELQGEVVATPRSCCDSLTTKGKCWTGKECNGTLTSSSTSCPNCRDYLQGKSFESLNSGKCYSTSD